MLSHNTPGIHCQPGVVSQTHAVHQQDGSGCTDGDNTHIFPQIQASDQQPPVTTWHLKLKLLRKMTFKLSEMETMLTSFLRSRHQTNSLLQLPGIWTFEENDLQTVRNEDMKLLSGIQIRAEDSTRQPNQPTLSRTASTLQYDFHTCAIK